MSDSPSHVPRTPALRSLLDTLGTVAFIVVCGVMAWSLIADRGPVRPVAVPPTRPAAPPLPTEPVSLEGAQLRGRADAQVAVIEFSDFQCPYCGAFARDTLPVLEQRYVDRGQVLLAFRHLPLSMHPFAQKAAEAAECAGGQQQFWPMHDALFLDQRQLDVASLRARAKRLGLDAKAFTTCLAGARAAKVSADAALARKLGVTGTPTFFLGTRQADGRVKLAERLSGALPAADFSKAIDALLGAPGQ